MKTIEFLKENNVDIEKSLELFGDMETYNETLKEFQEGIDNKLAEITKYYNEADMANYAIYVHSLKSDCKYFGFTKLAEMSYEHEMQSKADNYEFVKENYEPLMEEAAKIKKLVNEYMEVEDENSSITKPQVSEDEDNRNIILVADDSEVVRMFVKKIFDEKFRLVSATNGEEAINIIKEHEIDNKIKCILLDLNMPKVDGFAVLDYINEKDLFLKSPVSIISGDTTSEAINKAFSYPIVDMINKPFSEEKIQQIVEKTMSFAA